MKKIAENTLLALFISVFMGITPVLAFDFGGAPIANPSVTVGVHGDTAWQEAGAGLVNIDIGIKNLTSKTLTGEMRVIVVAINSKIDFDQVIVTQLKGDDAGDTKDHVGFYAENLTISPLNILQKKFRIAVPAGSLGKNVQVMVLFNNNRVGGAPETYRETYALPMSAK